MRNLYDYTLSRIDSKDTQGCSYRRWIGRLILSNLNDCTLSRINSKHTPSDYLFAHNAYKGLNGLTVGLTYICMYPIYQVCLRVWQKDTPKGYYFDNRWYTSVASATTGLDSTRLSTPTGVVHWATLIASMHNLIIYLCQRRQSTHKTIKQEDCAIPRSPLLLYLNRQQKERWQTISPFV